MTKHLNPIVLTVTLTVSLIFTLLVGTFASAQDSTPEATDETSTDTQVVYYLADGENGVDQVFRQVLDGQNNRQQLTNSESDIVAFGVSADGMSVAYIANGRLQLQDVDGGNTAEELVGIDGGQRQASPVFSPDGQYLAYADHGVWLMDLNTRETTQILEDVEFDQAKLNAGDVRFFRPYRFFVDPTTDALKLVVHINLYEYFSAGVYDIATDTFQELDSLVHHSLLPLSDGRVLIYGNTAITGDETLEIAASSDDLADVELLLDMTTLPNYSTTYLALFVYEVVEINPETVRVFAYPLQVNPPPTVFGIYEYYFDVDLDSGAASEIQQMKLGDMEPSTEVFNGPASPSPDGTKIAGYGSFTETETGTRAGTLQIFDLNTGELLSDVFPDRVSEFQWEQLSPLIP